MKTCPCGNKSPFIKCCGAIHNNQKNAETAEELMRSRYSAFTTGNGNYLLKSQSIQTREESNKEEIIRWAKSVKWIKLEIINIINGGKKDSTGIVECKAHYRRNFLKYSIHERSKFIQEKGKWYYLEGIHF